MPVQNPRIDDQSNPEQPHMIYNSWIGRVKLPARGAEQTPNHHTLYFLFELGGQAAREETESTQPE